MDQGEGTAHSLLRRIDAARGALAAAVEAKDSASIAAALDELEQALRQARENGDEPPVAMSGLDEREGS